MLYVILLGSSSYNFIITILSPKSDEQFFGYIFSVLFDSKVTYEGALTIDVV